MSSMYLHNEIATLLQLQGNKFCFIALIDLDQDGGLVISSCWEDLGLAGRNNSVVRDKLSEYTTGHLNTNGQRTDIWDMMRIFSSDKICLYKKKRKKKKE